MSEDIKLRMSLFVTAASVKHAGSLLANAVRKKDNKDIEFSKGGTVWKSGNVRLAVMCTIPWRETLIRESLRERLSSRFRTIEFE